MSNREHTFIYETFVSGQKLATFSELKQCQRWIMSYDPDGSVLIEVREFMFDGSANVQEKVLSIHELWGITPIKIPITPKVNWEQEGF